MDWNVEAEWKLYNLRIALKKEQYNLFWNIKYSELLSLIKVINPINFYATMKSECGVNFASYVNTASKTYLFGRYRDVCKM